MSQKKFVSIATCLAVVPSVAGIAVTGVGVQAIHAGAAILAGGRYTLIDVCGPNKAHVNLT